MQPRTRQRATHIPVPSSKQERKRGELTDEPQQERLRAPTGASTRPQRGTEGHDMSPKCQSPVLETLHRDLRANLKSNFRTQDRALDTRDVS